ncbi:MAG: hypothetical protein HN981_03265 [Candidatus Pacebacteria bacterium]|jgi:hypothetical protein|nr:hypothetical protein [Candidatus Paceibacterota bacterium]MBT4652126.1 hypothetical protein [Candidatus Paceibacterota bacterium]MBT6756557.1 hypothetical protein [Candidatus Paceibacterota bacterium]MBT6921382.1 hypothetical protein [Candidatus Paceibacterota bacterium]
MTHSKEIQIHTAENLRKNKDGSLVLEVILNSHKFDFPVVNVGSESEPAYIAILDPRIPEIQEHGAEVISGFLQELGVSLVITAPSSKSEKMIKEATLKAGIEKPPIIAVGGSTQKDGEKYLFTEDEVRDLASAKKEKAEELDSAKNKKIWVEECRPITLAPGEPSKFFALTEKMIDQIIQAVKNEETIAVVDDVYSSGATIESIQNLLKKAFEERKENLPTVPIIVVAREAVEVDPMFGSEEAALASNEDLNLFAAILIPVLLSLPEDIKE